MTQASNPLEKLPFISQTEAGPVLNCACRHGTKVPAPAAFGRSVYVCGQCHRAWTEKPDGQIVPLVPVKAKVQA